MRRAETVFIFAMAALLGGCGIRKPQTAKAAPVAPKPAAPAAPPPPPEPLSIPQTDVQLPPPQPITEEALATTIPAGEPPPPAPTIPRSTPRPITPRTGGSAPPRPEPAAPAPATPPAVEAERPPISELTPAPELKRMQEEADGRILEVSELIRRIPRSRLRQQQPSVERINTFLKQAEEARRRGDMRQASELAGRALVLARELK